MAVLAFTFASAAPAAAEPVRIVALGDSLTAGAGLSAGEAFPARLEKALKTLGYDVAVANAGVGGDTTTGGLARLDWSVPQGTQAVILELGANDMLRGVDPLVPRHNLTEIIQRLKARNIRILLAGMRAAPNLGPEYVARFESIYPDLAKEYGLIYYPFFLQGVTGVGRLGNGDGALVMKDGLHPTALGVDRIVVGIMPDVIKLMQETKGVAAAN